MIELTKMNHEKFYVNPMLIEVVEVTPDRLITLAGDKKYYVLETVEEITEKMEDFYRRIYTTRGEDKIKYAE
ncbi:MAG: flagellar FlbD family protein [Clostridiaceae bacterium]|nr:flagellar FlbD family protein [Clostridiaceae bacterium]